jgi:hypothetical protein
VEGSIAGLPFRAGEFYIARIIETGSNSRPCPEETSKMRRARCLAVAAILVGIVYSAAPAELQVSGGLSLAWPQKDFSQQVNFAWGGGGRAGYGLGGGSAVCPAVFADFNYLNYGRERRVEPFSLTIPDVVVDVLTDNYMLMVSPGFSLGLRKGPVRPYGEVYFGLTYIATRTTIQNHGLQSEPIASSTNFSDWTYNFGAGGGFQVPLWNGRKKAQIDVGEVLLDIKVNYIKGGNAEYLRKGSIHRSLGRVEYDTVESPTDMVQARIGVTCRF